MAKRAVGRPPGSRDRCGAARRVDAQDVRAMTLLFGDHLRRVREEANVSATELAAAVGYCVDTIHAYERGAIVPSLRALIAIAFALKLPLEHLVPR